MLSDAQQDAYFPKLEEDYFYSSIGSDDIARCSYRPASANGYNLAFKLWGVCAPQDEAMLTRLSALFSAFFETIVTDSGVTNAEALDSFDAEKDAPASTWAEIAPQ